jgi:hypothetical protein
LVKKYCHLEGKKIFPHLATTKSVHNVNPIFFTAINHKSQ